MECEEYRDRGDDMARLGTAKSRLSTYLLVLALTTPAMVLGQSRQAQPPAQTEEERARELAVIDAEILRFRRSGSVDVAGRPGRKGSSFSGVSRQRFRPSNERR